MVVVYIVYFCMVHLLGEIIRFVSDFGAVSTLLLKVSTLPLIKHDKTISVATPGLQADQAAFGSGNGGRQR